MHALKQASGAQLPLGGFGTGNMVMLDGGKRVRLDDKVDFWPATGTWRTIEGERTGTGMASLLAFLKQERENEGRPVLNPEPLRSELEVACQYCRRPAELHSALEVYPDRKDLAHRKCWVCWGCNAWVGCHAESDKPMGELADEALRDARIAAHDAFDPVWKDQRMSKTAAYEWLSQALGIPKDQCHIAQMSLDVCRRVSQVVYERFGRLSS